MIDPEFNLSIERLSPSLGLAVEGFSSADLNANPARQVIRDLLEQHQVVVIRNQSLNAHQLREFTRYFGPLFHHHADEGVLYADGLPEVLEMRKEPDGNRLFGGSDWHADVTFRNPAGYVSVLQSVILPPAGGDTGFVSTIAALDALSDGFPTKSNSSSANQ